MSEVLNLSQFTITNVLGAFSRGPQPGTFSGRILNTSIATGIQVGSPLKLVSAANTAELVFDIATEGSDVVFGVIPYNTKKNTYVAGDVVECASNGDTLFLEATAAITRGAKVSAGNTSATGGGPGVTTNATSGQNILGIALTQVSAAQQLVLVRIQPALNP